MKKDGKKETNNQFFSFLKEADSANDKMLPASKQKENNYEQRKKRINCSEEFSSSMTAAIVANGDSFQEENI